MRNLLQWARRLLARPPRNSTLVCRFDGIAKALQRGEKSFSGLGEPSPPAATSELFQAFGLAPDSAGRAHHRNRDDALAAEEGLAVHQEGTDSFDPLLGKGRLAGPRGNSENCPMALECRAARGGQAGLRYRRSQTHEAARPCAGSANLKVRPQPPSSRRPRQLQLADHFERVGYPLH